MPRLIQTENTPFLGFGSGRDTVTFQGLVGAGSGTSAVFSTKVHHQRPDERVFIALCCVLWSADGTGEFLTFVPPLPEGACYAAGGFCGQSDGPGDLGQTEGGIGGGGGSCRPSGSQMKFAALGFSPGRDFNVGDSVVIPTTGTVDRMEWALAVFTRAGNIAGESNKITQIFSRDGIGPHESDGCKGGHIGGSDSWIAGIGLEVMATYAVGVTEDASQPDDVAVMGLINHTTDPGTPTWNYTEIMHSEGTISWNLWAPTRGSNCANPITRIYWGFAITNAAHNPDIQWACPGTHFFSDFIDPGSPPHSNTLVIGARSGSVDRMNEAPCCSRGITINERLKLHDHEEPDSFDDDLAP